MAEKNKMTKDQLEYAQSRLNKLERDAKYSIGKKHQYPTAPVYTENDINKKRAVEIILESNSVRLGPDIFTKSGLKKYNDYEETCKAIDREHKGKIEELNQVFTKAWDQLYFGDAIELFSNIEKSIADLLK